MSEGVVSEGASEYIASEDIESEGASEYIASEDIESEGIVSEGIVSEGIVSEDIESEDIESEGIVSEGIVSELYLDLTAFATPPNTPYKITDPISRVSASAPPLRVFRLECLFERVFIYCIPTFICSADAFVCLPKTIPF